MERSVVDPTGPARAVGRRIVWFHPRPLLPVRGGGEVRVTGLVHAAATAGHEVLVVQPGPLTVPQPSSYRILEVPVRSGVGLAVAKVLSRAPLRTARLTPAGRSAAQAEIRSFDPDVSIVSDLLSWPVARDLLPGKPWILDAHNVETELFREFAEHSRGAFDRATFAIDHRRVARLERQVVGAADAVVTVSSEDAHGLARLGSPRRAPIVVPSSVRTPPAARAPVAEPTLLFVGTLDFPPNVAAVSELARDLLPILREKVPGVSLTVIGRRPSPELRALLAGTPHVRLEENVTDLTAYYERARAVVLPIRTGGGSRLKVYEALSYGVPVVGTTRALSGVRLEPHEVVRADSKGELVAGAVRVLTDDRFAAELGARGREAFVDRLSWAHAAAPLLALFDELCG